jgi:hypothetical protein
MAAMTREAAELLAQFLSLCEKYAASVEAALADDRLPEDERSAVMKELRGMVETMMVMDEVALPS